MAKARKQKKPKGRPKPVKPDLNLAAQLLLEGECITKAELDGKILTLSLGSNKRVELTIQGKFTQVQGNQMASALKELLDAQQPAADDAARFAWMNELGDYFVDILWLDFQMWRQTEGVTEELLGTVINGAGTDARKMAAQHFLDVTRAGRSFSASDSRVRDLIVAAQLPAQMQASLQALATRQATRWVRENIGVPHSIGSIEKARTI